ncbi:MAG: ABC transporter substrate-binding protein [Polyangiales bacterium]
MKLVARSGSTAPPRHRTHPIRWALLWVLASCGQASDARKESAADSVQLTTPKPGGELVFAFDGAALAQFALDPHKSAFAPHHRVMRSIFDSLVVALPDHHFGPWLAQSWEISEDGKTYTFHLRTDVKFHDGTSFDADAVKWNLDRIKDPKNALLALSDIGPYESATVVDPATVRVQLSEPFAPFLAHLSKSCLGIISPTAARTYGDDVASHPTGTGPFKLQSLTAPTEIVLVRNQDYAWPPSAAKHSGPAYLERIVFKNVPEEATRVAVLLNGQAGASDLIPPQNLAGLKSSASHRVIEGELLNQNYSLYLNVEREPWRDPRIREAFKQSLDLDAAVRTIYLGTQARAWSPLSPSLFAYDKTLENSWKPDRAAAARTLDELGWKPGPDGVRVKDGKRLQIVFLDTQGNREKRLDVITFLRRQLRDNGFELRIDTQPAGLYQAKAAAGDFDLLAGSLFAPDPDVLRRIHSPTLRSAIAVSRTDDPELTQLLDAGTHELDNDKRRQIYARAQHLIVERGYAIPVYVLSYSIASKTQVDGIEIDRHGFPVFYDSWIHS